MICNVDLIKKSVVEDARLLVINKLGPSNFEKPSIDKPLVYIGDRVDAIDLSEAAVTSWAANRFKPKFANNWVSGETRGEKTNITISIPENLRLALNVKYGGLSLAEANASLKGIDPDSLETGLTGSIKPGVSELFESNPELANVGTPEQYSQYLDTIFPDSKVKDIVYHGTRDKYDNLQGETFFSFEREYADNYSKVASKKEIESGVDKTPLIYAALINATTVTNQKDIANFTLPKEFDTVVGNDAIGTEKVIVPKNANQIHILGSKQDIEGFKEFAQQGTDVERYNGLEVVDTSIKTNTGEPGGGRYDRANNRILINRELLRKKFDEKAWTKPRRQTDGSFVTPFSEDFFSTYEQWEKFVLEHEYQHSLLSFEESGTSIVGEYEDIINNRALAAIEQVERETITQEDLVSIAERELVEENKALAEMGAATTQGNDTARATNAVSKLVDQINSYAERIGVEYEILSTVEEAANVIGNANTIGGLSANSIIASGAPAFFYNGKVYFIASRLSTSDIFHEFGHPIIKAIANIEGQKLFNSLYNEAIGTDEGFAIYQQMLEEFPEGSENTDDFKEELIMRSLDRIHASEKFGEPISPGFKSYVKKLFFNVKQFLRKVFGTKVKVEKLSANTTLAELAEMIAGDKFSIDVPKITTEDFVAFRTATARTISEINKIADDDLFILMDDYRRTLSTIKFGLRTNNIKDLEKLLFGDDENKKVLAESLSDISGALNNIDKLKLAAATAVQIESQKTIAANRLAENLNSIGNIIKLLEDSIINVDPNSLSSDDQKAFIAKLTYANTIIAYVNELFFNTQDAMKKAGVSEKSAEWQTITEFFGKVPSFERTVNQKQIKVLSGFTSSIVEDMRQSVIEKAKRDLRKVISENPSIGTKIDNGFEKLTDSDFTDVNARVRTQLENTYNSFKDDYQALTKDAMENILSGNYKDNGRLNALFESYTNNQNPVVGSFAAFYKQQQAMAEAKTSNEVEKFMAGLRPLVEGMSQDEIANMSKDFVFEDKTFRINNDNEVEERLVLTYLNKFKDYRYELKKREIAYENASRKGTFAERSAAYAELQQFKKDYMWQEYAQEYYELEKIYFDAGQVGIDALLEKQILLDQINSTQRSAITETELFDKNGEIEALQRRYRQLFSMTYEDGITPKQGDDLVKTELHRAYREKSNSFVDYNLIPGAFERALRNYLDELALTETPGTPEYYAKRDEWIRINSQIEYTDDYYDARREAIQNLRDFSETYLPDSAEAKLIVENYNIIYSLLSVFRDTDNQPDAEEIGVDRLKNIKRLHEEIETARDNMSGVYGLSKTERLELSSYFDIINSGASLNVYEQKRFDRLLAKQKSGGLSKALTAQYKKLIAAVSELTYKSPTTQYLDKMNYWLNDVLDLGLPEITEENADEYLDYDKMYNYLKLDPNFKQWFEDNHYVKEYYDKDLEEIVYTYKRISAWEVARPTDENYLKETKLNIIDEVTGLPMVIKRVPKARFKKRSVKDEFRLVKENEDPAKYVGIYYDNRGKYLPRDYRSGDPNSAKSDLLINQEYEKLRVSDPKKFAILEYFKAQQLKEEEKVNQNYAKLYLDVPRYGLKKGFEDVKNKAKTVQQNLRSIKGMLNRQKLDDDVSAELMAEEGLNIDANLAFVDTDILGNTREVIPIGGMTAFENDRVSKDVVRGHIKRMIDIAKFNVLQETAPVAKAFMETLNNNQPKDMNAIDRRIARTTGKLQFTKSKSDSNVAGEAMAYFYQREYLGKARGEEMDPVIDKMVKGLMKQVSFGYFALDLASAAKNYFSQLIQNGIETAGGEYINAQSLAAGKAMAYAHVTKNLFQRLDRNTRDLSSQMILAFDPVQDRYKDDFADSYTNSLWNELASVKFFMSPRRFLERESVLELFFGMMHKKLIEQTLPDGKTKTMIRYSDAFEVNADGEMILKPGIDQKYAVGGSEFAKFRIVVQEKSNLLYGTYAKFDQPMAGKYFAYRLGSFLRRYFTSMFLNRWAFRLEKGGSLLKGSTYKYRYNWALNEMTRGYYVESMIALVKTIRTVGAYIPYMPKSEAVAIRKTLYDFMAATLLAILPKLLFGYESGDDDRFEKLRALSGPLGSDNFEIDGWLAQHAIYQMKAVFGETTTFIPVPGLGEAEVLDMVTISNVLLGRGIGNYTTLFLDLYYISIGDERAVYKRDMGPFSWQEKGDYKIYNHLGKMAGVKGKFWDPVLAIKAQETVEAMGQSR